jgi:hypothetical protein
MLVSQAPCAFIFLVFLTKLPTISRILFLAAQAKIVIIEIFANLDHECRLKNENNSDV